MSIQPGRALFGAFLLFLGLLEAGMGRKVLGVACIVAGVALLAWQALAILAWLFAARR